MPCAQHVQTCVEEATNDIISLHHINLQHAVCRLVAHRESRPIKNSMTVAGLEYSTDSEAFPILCKIHSYNTPLRVKWNRNTEDSWVVNHRLMWSMTYSNLVCACSQSTLFT